MVLYGFLPALSEQREALRLGICATRSVAHVTAAKHPTVRAYVSITRRRGQQAARE